MTTKSKIITGVLVIVTAYAFGYYMSPEKIKTETKIVEVEKKQKDTTTATDRDKHRETTTTEITRPDGTKEVVTKVVEDTSTNRNTQTSESSEIEKSRTDTKEVTKSRSRLTLAALGGIPINFSGAPVLPIYGGYVSKEVLGPISIGVWGLSSREGGLSLGLNF